MIKTTYMASNNTNMVYTNPYVYKIENGFRWSIFPDVNSKCLILQIVSKESSETALHKWLNAIFNRLTNESINIYNLISFKKDANGCYCYKWIIDCDKSPISLGEFKYDSMIAKYNIINCKNIVQFPNNISLTKAKKLAKKL
ncbi:MAG: hypothetical protein BAJALOKI3v1_50027 [Promethearchaeota archaeon]|nr:MAG: hypothetical protein BAJALOKI3v1_50027 [Candidatus Lokiarchaeota archaeon]